MPETDRDDGGSKRGAPRWLIVVALAPVAVAVVRLVLPGVAAAVVGVVVASLSPIAAAVVGYRDWLAAFTVGLGPWVESLGPWGPAAFVGAYVLLTTFASPMWPLTVLSGVLFGPVVGVVLASVASTLAASVGMLGARYLARDFVAMRLGDSRHFTRLNGLIAQHGVPVVAFTRLVPLFPFSPLNLAFGLTPVPATTYIFWSWLCMLPTTVIYVVGGGTLKLAIAEGRVPWAAIAVAVAVAAGLAVVVRSIRRKMAAEDGGTPDDSAG